MTLQSARDPAALTAARPVSPVRDEFLDPRAPLRESGNRGGGHLCGVVRAAQRDEVGGVAATFERGDGSGVEGSALGRERRDAALGKGVAVHRVDRDQVTLRVGVPAYQSRDTRAEQIAHRVRADARVALGFMGYERSSDVVDEPGDLQLDVVGPVTREQRRALQRVREEIDGFVVVVRGACFEDVEERGNRGGSGRGLHSPLSGGGGR